MVTGAGSALDNDEAAKCKELRFQPESKEIGTRFPLNKLPQGHTMERPCISSFTPVLPFAAASNCQAAAAAPSHRSRVVVAAARMLHFSAEFDVIDGGAATVADLLRSARRRRRGGRPRPLRTLSCIPSVLRFTIRIDPIETLRRTTDESRPPPPPPM